MSVDIDSFDGVCDVWDEDVRRARRDRLCSACHEPIRRGDLYHSTRSLYDGSWSTVSRCARCETVYRILSSMLPAGEVCDERLNCGHEWAENFGGEPPVEVQALAFLTPAEAQTLLSKPWVPLPYDQAGPREDPARKIARILGWGRTEGP